MPCSVPLSQRLPIRTRDMMRSLLASSIDMRRSLLDSSIGIGSKRMRRPWASVGLSSVRSRLGLDQRLGARLRPTGAMR